MKEIACSKLALKKFKGKHILITGASGALGRAFGLHLAQSGARTLVLSGRNEIFLEHLANECREVSTNFMEVHIIVCDLSDPLDVVKLGHKALSLCNINVLINNAGVMIRDDFLETKPEVDQMIMQVNFLSGVTLAKMIVPCMMERGGDGTILWISSVQGFYSLPGCSSFAASKFAVQGYAEAMRAELANSGITVHVASPGFIRTKFENGVGIDTSPRARSSARKAKGALPENVAADILNAVAKGKRDFLVASSLADRSSIWMRLLAPGWWNKHLIKVHEENLRLAAEMAANDISLEDDLKDSQIELKEVDTDTVSIVSRQSHQSDLKTLAKESNADVDDIYAVLVEAPSDLDLDEAQEETMEAHDTDADSVESVGSQLVRLAAGH